MSEPKSVHARYGVKTSVGWYAGKGLCNRNPEKAKLYRTLGMAGGAVRHVTRHYPQAVIKVVPFQICEIG